jgi:uncharacterized membrane protein
MELSQAINVALHIGAGSAALALGLLILAKHKGTPAHRRLGRAFCHLTGVACLTAVVGLVFFRLMPLFAVLTVLVAVQFISGWRAIYTQDRGPTAWDSGVTVMAAVFAAAMVPTLFADSVASRSVVLSTLGGLAAVLAYDLAKWFFPRHWHARLWRYEHAYKMLAALFGLLSALVGNVIRVGQPWSQLAPSAIGALVAMYFFLRVYRTKAAT